MYREKDAYINRSLFVTFVAVSETGSFTSAAEKVGRTVAAVSMQMTRLEALF